MIFKTSSKFSVRYLKDLTRYCHNKISREFPFSATIDVKKGNYSQDFIFDIPGNSQFVRSNPGTSDMRGLETVTVEVINVAMALFASTPAGAIWTAASILSDLGAEFNKNANIDNNDEKKYT